MFVLSMGNAERGGVHDVRYFKSHIYILKPNIETRAGMESNSLSRIRQRKFPDTFVG
jgi:hypothetical protein